MKILITNNAVAYRSGSELYVQELAQELANRGHQVAVFTTELGDLGRKMEAYGIIVTDDLEKIPWVPDIIHAQHHLETMIALAYFLYVPAIYVCHGWRPWQEAPPKHPRIMHYKAVDIKTLQEAVEKHDIPAENIAIVHNFVDLKRFKPRNKLPERPKKALVFSNYADDNNFLPHIRKACEKAGIALDVVGASYGNSTDKPEEILVNYDLVFAVGRSALEALASGVSVVICGVWGIGPLVRFEDVEILRDKNYGTAAIYADLDADILYKEICRYNAQDAEKVMQFLRERVGLENAADNLEKIYASAIEKYDSEKFNIEEDLQFQAEYLQKIAVFLKQNISDRNAIGEKNAQIAKMNHELATQKNEISLMQSSKFWKARNYYIKIKSIFKK